jgi:hypothetical protein
MNNGFPKVNGDMYDWPRTVPRFANELVNVGVHRGRLYEKINSNYHEHTTNIGKYQVRVGETLIGMMLERKCYNFDRNQGRNHKAGLRLGGCHALLPEV